MAHFRLLVFRATYPGELQGSMMAEEVSVLRLYVMRGIYLLNCVLVGLGVEVQFVHRQQPWDPMVGGGVQLLGGLSGPVYSGNPLPAGDASRDSCSCSTRHFWLLAVYVPLRAAGRSTDLTQGMLIGIVLDIIVIPRPYVFAHYMKKPGDRWR